MTDFPDETTRPRSATVEGYRNVAAIVLALTVMQAAIGALSVVGPLSLLAQGASSLKIGAIVTGYALGFLLGAHWAPKEIRRIGHIRAVAAFAAAASIAAALLHANDALIWWMLMQFIMGSCVAGLLASGESWIADAAPSDSRGSILGFYLVASKVGFMAGPFIVSTVPTGSATGFLIVAILFTASLIPACATNRAHPRIPDTEPFSPLKVWRIAPSAIIAAFTAGLVNGAVLQLYAVYSGSLGGTAMAQTAAIFNAALIGGSVLAQWPAGIISDRMDRRIVIAALAIISGAAALVLALFSGILPQGVIYAVAAIWGAGALSYYGIAVAHAADRAPEGDATSMMSGILMVWALGSIIGPLGASSVMSLTGPSGLFLFAAVALAALAIAMVYRRTGKAPVREDEKSDFEPTSATSIAVVELTEVAGEEAEQHADDAFDGAYDYGFERQSPPPPGNADEGEDGDRDDADSDDEESDGYWRN